MTLLKKCLPDVLAVLLFAVLAFAYFFPADIEGRILYRHDASAGRGAGQEGIEYLQKTGERSRWTNALFGGMPTYQMAPSYHSTDNLSQAINARKAAMPVLECRAESDLLSRICPLLDRLYESCAVLSSSIGKCAIRSGADLAHFSRQCVIPAMEDARRIADELELLVPHDRWPFPTYGDILFYTD